MTSFIITVHILACIALIGIVLIQRGRGSGLVESLSGIESIFGTRTNAFLTRATTILSTLFFFTCLGLAVLSVKQSRSLMIERKLQPSNQTVSETATQNQTVQTPPKPEEKPVE